MTAILVTFMLSLTIGFLGMMLLGVLVHVWPLVFVVGLWLLYREHNKRRREEARRSC